MALLDVNMLVALVWDSHVHHTAARRWFAEHAAVGWATCPITESGFVRVSSNPKVLPVSISVGDARQTLIALCGAPGHQFLSDDVSLRDHDVPTLTGHRQITDAHLLVLARRRGHQLVTFDTGVSTMDQTGADVLLLEAL